MLYIDKNPFTWHKSADLITSPMLSLKFPEIPKNIEDLQEPVMITLPNYGQCLNCIMKKTKVPFLAHLAKRPCELLPSLCVRRPSVNFFKIFSETTEPILTKLGHNHPQGV